MKRRGWTPKSNERITEQNYKDLLELEYDGKFQWTEPRGKNNKVRIGIKCNDCGHEWKASPYDMLKRGRTCPSCADKERAQKSWKEITDKMIEYYGELPYEFHSEFTTKADHMEVTCKKCGNRFKITPNNMISTRHGIPNRAPCQKCFEKEHSKFMMNNKNLYLDKINTEFGRKYYEMVDVNQFKGSSVDQEFKCLKCGHIFISNQYAMWRVLKDSQGKKYICPKCNDKIWDTRPYPERLKEVNPNIIALEDYIARDVHIKHKCKICNNIWLSTPNSRLQNPGCPKCNNIITESKMERELEEFIQKVYDGEIISNSRHLLGNGQEIDIYIPEFKLGIEMHGLYWHNEEKKGKEYHLTKLNLANERGIDLIQIFEDEWIHKQEIVKSKILHKLHLNTTKKIYGRNTYVDTIPTPAIKNKFLEENHIQGADRSKIHLGLYDKTTNELVSVMTFTNLRSSLGNKDSHKLDYELSRFASKKDINVIGGFSKLLTHFIRTYPYRKIITYADLRYSSRLSNVYEVNNFIKTHESKPSYWYFHRNSPTKKYHRYTFRKNILKNKLNTFDSNLTEYENMLNNNYLRIWDCGNMVFTYKG